MSECRIDISALTKQLGLKYPVHLKITPTFETEENLSAAARTDWLPDGTHLIEIQPGVINIAVADPKDTTSQSFAAIVVHEVWHAKQAEDSGLTPEQWRERAMMINSLFDWSTNPYERDALAHQTVGEYLKDVKIIGDCKEWGDPYKLEELVGSGGTMNDLAFKAIRTHSANRFIDALEQVAKIAQFKVTREVV